MENSRQKKKKKKRRMLTNDRQDGIKNYRQ